MAPFHIQNNDGFFTSVSHDNFYELLNSEQGYLYFKRGGKHIAMLPTEENNKAISVCRQAENAENHIPAIESRCKDDKGCLCRYQHDDNGRLIRNSEGKPVSAKCGDCPRNGWTAGKRENCCIRNYCKIEDCTYCPNPREYHAPISLEWLTEDKDDLNESGGAGLQIADPDADIQAAFERSELVSALHEALGQLPLDEQHILKAIFWDRISQRAYAVENGLSRSVVKRLHDHALESLKKVLKDFC